MLFFLQRFDEKRTTKSEVPLEALDFPEEIIAATVQALRNIFSLGTLLSPPPSSKHDTYELSLYKDGSLCQNSAHCQAA